MQRIKKQLLSRLLVGFHVISTATAKMALYIFFNDEFKIPERKRFNSLCVMYLPTRKRSVFIPISKKGNAKELPKAIPDNFTHLTR